MSTVEERPIGYGRLERKEDERFIRGQGNYLDDISLPGMLHGAILRSPLAHARIVSIDTSAALQHPKVHAVVTGEDLEQDGVLDPIQEGFMRCHGLQCGFCTPGMLMTTRALLDRDPDPSEQTIREAISGQICRCTGYTTIVRSVQWAAEHPLGELS